MRNVMIAAGLLASLTVARGALAEESTTTSASASGSSQANVGVSLPGATTTTTTTVTVGGTDHAQMVGRLAVGYFGIANVGAGANTGASGANDSPYAITGIAPVVGVRYWLDPMIGLDVGVGLSLVGGSVKPPAGAAKFDRGSFSGFLLHAGVPLALASSDHFTFEIIPEANVGFTGGSIDPNGDAAGDVSYSGIHFDLGARAGAEIHFGFIKLPQLSLVGSVGLRFDTDSGKTNDTVVPGAPAGATAPGKSSSSRSEFHTIVGANPWAIFTNQVAALYYF